MGYSRLSQARSSLHLRTSIQATWLSQGRGDGSKSAPTSNTSYQSDRGSVLSLVKPRRRTTQVECIGDEDGMCRPNVFLRKREGDFVISKPY